MLKMSHQESQTFVDTFHVIAFPRGNSQTDHRHFQTRLEQHEAIRFLDIQMYPSCVGNMVKNVLSWQQQNVGTSWAIRFQSKGLTATDKGPIFYHHRLKEDVISLDNHLAEQMFKTKQLIETSPTVDELAEAEQSIKQDGLQQVSAGVLTFEIHVHNRILAGGRMSQRFLSVFDQLMYYYYKKREKFFPTYLNMQRKRRAIAEANYALNINNMYDQLEEYTTQRRVPDDLHPPLSVTLRPYQQRSLQYCLDVENKTDELWLPFHEGRIFYSPHFMLFSDSKHEMSGGFLCDEMGLGKTIVSLGLITLRPPLSDFSSLSQHGNTLVVCPVSLASQWVKEAKKHISADVKIYLHHGSNRWTDRERIASNDIVVTTYGVLSRDTSLYDDTQPRQGSLDRIQWWRVIFDESHIMKNVNTRQYKASMHIKAKHRWVVTGTPSGNEGQIYAQINLISKYLRRFVSGYFVYGSYTDPVFTILSAFMIRHRKNMTIDGSPILELPECTVNNCYIDLTEAEQDSYNQVASQARVMLPFTVGISAFREIQNVRRSLSFANVNNTSQSAMQMRTLNDIEREAAENRMQTDTCPICLDVHDLAVMTECNHLFCYQCITNVINMSSRQHPPCPMCRRGIHQNDLRLVHALAETTERSHSCSGKLDRIRSLLQETENTDKFLIFVQFQQTLGVARSMLNDQNIIFGEIHGSMSQRAREKALESFESDPEMRVFLLSTRSGAIGINLTSANHVILFEPFLSRNVEKQAIGRVWRMGQPRPVHVHRFVARHTLEERIVDQQARQETESETWSHESIRQLLE